MPTVPQTSSPMTAPAQSSIGQPSSTLFAIAAVEGKRKADKTASILGPTRDQK